MVIEPPATAVPGVSNLKPRGYQHQNRLGRRLAQGEVGRRTDDRLQSRSALDVRRSPPWYGALILALLIVGVAVIVLNYLGHIPGVAHGSPWGLVAGLVMIFAGFLLATRYR